MSTKDEAERLADKFSEDATADIFKEIIKNKIGVGYPTMRGKSEWLGFI